MSEYFNASPRTLPPIGDNLNIIAGYTEPLARQLIIKSQEAVSAAMNPNNAQARFNSFEAFHRWQRAGRQVVYMLTNSEQDELGGLAWYEPAKLPRAHEVNPAPNHSFTMCLYRGYHNKSLALPFMAATLNDYITNTENGVKLSEFKGIWLRAETANKPVVRAYEKFGYETVTDDKGRLTMVLSPQRIPRALSSVG